MCENTKKLPYVTDHNAHFKIFFSKIDRAPHKSVLLMYSAIFIAINISFFF